MRNFNFVNFYDACYHGSKVFLDGPSHQIQKIFVMRL